MHGLKPLLVELREPREQVVQELMSGKHGKLSSVVTITEDHRFRIIDLCASGARRESKHVLCSGLVRRCVSDHLMLHSRDSGSD